MKAAVVRSFDAPPRYEDFELPPSSAPDEIVVEVRAVGLHPRVRSGAAGRHYADRPVLPMIPGVDAVGHLPDGTLAYCVVHDTPFGTLAERVVADRRRCIPLPDGCDEALIAAAMNPGMSSWIALRLRALLRTGHGVFVLGATGNAGRMAVQIAKLLGAGRVVGAGRDIARLESSGADEIVSLVGNPAEVAEAIGRAAGESDIVLDYLWSEPAAHAMRGLLTARRDRSKPLDWVQIGAITGPTMELPSELLRSTNIRLMGSGQGSVSPRAIVAELPSLVEQILAGRIPVEVVKVRLSQVAQAWSRPVPAGKRMVIVP